VEMGDLGRHKAPVVHRAIRAAVAEGIFLSPQGRGLNPIEQGFAKPGALVRKANARTFEAVRTAAGRKLLPGRP